MNIRLVPSLLAVAALAAQGAAQVSNYTNVKGLVATEDPETHLIYTAEPVGNPQQPTSQDYRWVRLCAVDLDDPANASCAFYEVAEPNHRTTVQDIAAFDGNVYVAATNIDLATLGGSTRTALVLSNSGGIFEASGYRSASVAISIEPILGHVGLTGYFDSDASTETEDNDIFVSVLSGSLQPLMSVPNAPYGSIRYKFNTLDDRSVDIRLRREEGSKPGATGEVLHTAVYLLGTVHGGSGAPRYWTGKIARPDPGSVSGHWGMWWNGVVGTVTSGDCAATAMDLEPHEDEGELPIPSEETAYYLTGYRPGPSPTTGDTDWATFRAQYNYSTSSLGLTGPWTHDGPHEFDGGLYDDIPSFDKPFYIEVIKDSLDNFRVLVAGASNPASTWYRRGLVKVYTATSGAATDVWLNGGSPSEYLHAFGVAYDSATLKVISGTARDSNRLDPKYYSFDLNGGNLVTVSSTLNISPWGLAIDSSSGDVCGVGTAGINVWSR